VARNIEIAVVDDDESFRTALTTSLSSLGYRADGYPSAEDYIAIADSTFDCVVSDVYMPGLSGLEMVRRLAVQGSTTPVVLITGRSDVSLEAKAAALGVVRLLRKPFEISDLVRCIEGAVKGLRC
jgi:FixJ family two-component response regulator